MIRKGRLSIVSLFAALAALVAATTDTAAVVERSYLILAREVPPPSGLSGAVEAAGGVVTAAQPAIGLLVARSREPDFAARAGRIPGVVGVARNVGGAWIAGPGIEGTLAAVGPETDPGTEAANPPSSGDNDPLFDFQWALDAIDAPEAWELGARGAGVRVAVLDTGINPDHGDLAGNVNMALAASFVPGEDVDVRPLPPPPRPFALAHGTHVAGIIAARDNGFGIIGVAPEAEIVPIQVLSPKTGFGSWDWIIAGIVYAADIDADVINMSLGGSQFRRGGGDLSDEGTPLSAAKVQVLVNALERAVAYAYHSGAVVVAAAGNAAADGDHDQDRIRLPSQLPFVVSVAATAPRGWGHDQATDLDRLASYSNYGQSEIDLAAPGGDADLSLTDLCRVKPPPAPLRPCWVFDLVLSTVPDPAVGWSWASGTSMAAPHVSGVAALIIGEHGGSMDPSEVVAILRASADDLGKPGRDDWYGLGRVNALNAVK